MINCKIILWATVVSVASLASLACNADDSESFMYRVCEILPEPFVGNISFGSGEGCAWGLVRPDGVTIREETAEGHATRYKESSDMQMAIDTTLAPFKMMAKEGLGKLQPLNICDGGWQFSSTILGNTSSRAGFYKCGSVFVLVQTSGPRSTLQFTNIAEGIKPLLPALK